MHVPEKLLPERIYLIRKRIIPSNRLSTGGENLKVIRENVNRFILTFSELIKLNFTKNEVLIGFKTHSEEVIRKLPRQVRDQKYPVIASKLKEYCAGKLPPLHELDDIDKTCMNLDPSYVLRKKVANFLQSFTRKYNHRCFREDRMFVRKTGIWEFESKEELQEMIEEICLAHGVKGDKTRPDQNYACTLGDLVRGGSDQIMPDFVLSLFNNDIQELLSRVLSKWEKRWGLKESPD